MILAARWCAKQLTVYGNNLVSHRPHIYVRLPNLRAFIHAFKVFGHGSGNTLAFRRGLEEPHSIQFILNLVLRNMNSLNIGDLISHHIRGVC